MSKNTPKRNAQFDPGEEYFKSFEGKLQERIAAGSKKKAKGRGKSISIAIVSTLATAACIAFFLLKTGKEQEPQPQTPVVELADVSTEELVEYVSYTADDQEIIQEFGDKIQSSEIEQEALKEWAEVVAEDEIIL